MTRIREEEEDCAVIHMVQNHLVCIVVDSLSCEIPDTEWNTVIVVLDVPRCYINAVSDFLSVAATADMFALCQGVHQTIHKQSIDKRTAFNLLQKSWDVANYNAELFSKARE